MEVCSATPREPGLIEVLQSKADNAATALGQCLEIIERKICGPGPTLQGGEKPQPSQPASLASLEGRMETILSRAHELINELQKL